MRGIPCVIPGALEIEGRKKASELISEVTWTPDGDPATGMSTVDAPVDVCPPAQAAGVKLSPLTLSICSY